MGVDIYLYSFLNLGARWGWVVNARPRPLYPRERPGTQSIGCWVGPGPVWTDKENLAITGIRSPDRPTRSESLHRLSYRGPYRVLCIFTIGKLKAADLPKSSPAATFTSARNVLRRLVRLSTWSLLPILHFVDRVSCNDSW